MLKPNLNNVSLVMSAGFVSQFPKDPIPQVAFSGRSNVGKSSLINRLLGRKSLARVSSATGKTITVNFYKVDGKFYLVDLPGYGYARRSADEQKKWSGLVDGYLVGEHQPDLVVQLIDMKTGPTTDDNMMLSFLNETGIPYVVVATKADKLNATDFAKMQSALRTHPLISENADIIPFSALKPVAADDIRKKILTMLDKE
jgi:GTP-binding protein